MTRKSKDTSRRSRSPRRRPIPDVDYDVGYRRPPANHQFQKGKSGNPKGRPRGRKNLEQMCRDAFLRRIPVVERDGTQHKMAKVQAMIENVATKAASGDPKQVKLALDVIERLGVRIDVQEVRGITIKYVAPDPDAEKKWREKNAKREEAERKKRAERAEEI